jgi:glycosyltransferase involved in cell wall biosynthesis
MEGWEKRDDKPFSRRNNNRSNETMKKIKIIYILNGLAVAGVEKVTIDICNNLDKELFEPYIVSLSNTYQGLRKTIAPHVSVFVLPFGYKKTGNPVSLYRQYRQLKKLFAELNPDIVQVSLYAARLFMVSCAVKRFSSTVPFVKTEHFVHHQFLPDTFKTKFSLLLEKKAFSQNKSYITTVSRSIYPDMQRLFGGVTKKIAIIENGINPLAYNRESYKRQRNELGLNGEDIIFVQVARLALIKDHRTLMNAWKKVADYFQCKPLFLKLLLIGEGGERTYIENFMKENQLQDTVVLTGSIDNVAEYLAVSDVGVLSSRGEGLCLALIEKMLMKLPLIVSDIESNRILVENNENGLLFPVGDEDALAKSIIYMVENSKERERMGENGYKKALQHFSLNSMINKYEIFYHEILSE